LDEVQRDAAEAVHVFCGFHVARGRISRLHTESGNLDEYSTRTRFSRSIGIVTKCDNKSQWLEPSRTEVKGLPILKKNKPHVLIVDDEEDIRTLLRMWLEARGMRVREAEDFASACRRLEEADYDLCLTDLRLPDGSGIDLLRKSIGLKPRMPVVVITAYGSVETAIEALKIGAFDFISKPIDFKVLQKLIDSALCRTIVTDPGATGLVGTSPAVLALRVQVAAVAPNRAPIVVCGESGTHKEMVAREIHRLAAPADRPFVSVNCPALSADRVEDAFFGLAGGEGQAAGFLHEAQGGTLFLREVVALPPFMQARLLDILQQRTIHRPGEYAGEVVDFRLVCSSTGDLQRAVAEGAFRDDLYYRLNVITVGAPPLRERMEDLPALCDMILADIVRRWERPALRLDAAALDQLSGYSFPGNLRELENILERAAALTPGGVIVRESLQLTGAGGASAAEGPPVAAADNLPDRLEADERAAIQAALEKTRWNRTAAAKLLGLSFRQLRYRIKKFGLDEQ